MNRKERRLKKPDKGKNHPSPATGQGAGGGHHVDTLELAIGHHQAGRLNEAEALYRSVLNADPENPMANHLFGVVACQKGDLETAIGAIDKSLKRDPDNGEAHKNLAGALIGVGRLEDAERHLLRAIDLKPGYAEALNNLSIVQLETGRAAEAIASAVAAIQTRPEYGKAHNSLGSALRQEGRTREAEQSYRRALELNPGNAEAWNNLGLIEKDGLRLEQAEAAFGNAARLKPGFADGHNNLGMLKLLQGDLKDGFAQCEWRTGLASMRPFLRRLPGQPWAGQDPVGQRLLVYAEQGLGDTLQFVRYLPMLKRLGCELFFECQPPLRRLLAQMDGIARVFAHGEDLPVVDLHVSLMSLPHLLSTTLSSIPAAIPYLRADPGLVEGWRQRLSCYQGLRVGLVWRGGAAHRNDANRSASLDLFQKYFDFPEAAFFCLQKEIPDHERPTPGAFVDIGGDFQDFADTAAAISALDLVISVDTASAHLAGALGVSTYVLLPWAPDWRWLLDRPDSPWYPGMRLFRQHRPGDWDGVLVRAAAQLETEARG
ncbi:MAG: glycosyltransferase family protein [Rhodospirillales bacterium]|nr:glycosyltransferase family protein [Rhodospirillales bacterium]